MKTARPYRWAGRYFDDLRLAPGGRLNWYVVSRRHCLQRLCLPHLPRGCGLNSVRRFQVQQYEQRFIVSPPAVLRSGGFSDL